MNKKAIISGIISVALSWLGLTIFTPVFASPNVRLDAGNLPMSTAPELETAESNYDPSRQTICRSGCDYVSITAAISATNPLTPALFSILDTEVNDYLIHIDGGKDVTILGLGIERTKIGPSALQAVQAGAGPVFIIDDGANVVFENLTITGGKSETEGGGIRISDDETTVRLKHVKVFENQGSSGGGIALLDQATLVVQDSIVEKNEAINDGGGLFVNAGQLTVERSLVRQNKATAGGGTFYANDQGMSLIINSTFAENSALLTTNSTTINRGGGAFYLANVANGAQSSEIDFRFNTVSNNQADVGETGGLLINGGTLNLFATILSANMGDGALENCRRIAGAITSEGYNLSSDSSCSLASSSDLVLAELTLAEIADNGGTSETFSIGQDSHAIGIVPSQHCPLTDQRMIDRGGDSACDIGAYEAEHYVTFCNAPNVPAGAIPDNDPAGLVDMINISHPGEIYDLSVLLQVVNDSNYINDFEAQVTLAAGTPTTISLISTPAILGGSCNPFGPSELDLRFNDSFSSQLTGSVCFMDSALTEDYQPISSSLNDFNGTELAGRWDLNLVDNAAGATGELKNWCVQAKIKPDSLTVTRADDPTPNGCDTGDCSLREAIIDANKYPGPDTITVDVPGPISLTQTGNGGNSTGDSSAIGDLDIADDLILRGNITDVVIIDASALNDRLFDIAAGVDVHISGFGLTGGTVSTGVRGGGAILNKGNFLGEHLLIRNNSTSQSFGYGGAIQSTSGGDFTLRNSEVISNSAKFVFSGIYNWNSVMELSGVTIAGNEGSGSVVYNFAAGGDSLLQLNSVTLASNSVVMDSGLGTFYSSSNANPEMAITYLHNSVIGSHAEKGCKVGASSDNNSSVLVSLGYNLAEDDSCALLLDSDLPSVDPLLMPLAAGDGGQYTGRLVLMPQTLSPIHDHGAPSECPSTDGRGASRPQHATCDIGAIELTTAEIPARIFLPITGR